VRTISSSRSSVTRREYDAPARLVSRSRASTVPQAKGSTLDSLTSPLRGRSIFPSVRGERSHRMSERGDASAKNWAVYTAMASSPCIRPDEMQQELGSVLCVRPDPGRHRMHRGMVTAQNGDAGHALRSELSAILVVARAGHDSVPRTNLAGVPTLSVGQVCTYLPLLSQQYHAREMTRCLPLSHGSQLRVNSTHVPPLRTLVTECGR
jgi:hypothetical protein